MGSREFGQIPMAILLVVMIYVLIGQFLKAKNFHLIHETSFGIMAGLLVGGIYTLLDPTLFHELFTIDTSIFFYLILPVIIFAGGYNLKKKKFLNNFRYIILFGFVSTLLNYLFTFSLTIAINQIGFVTLTTGQIMLYSATICATDSVAALTLISSDKYPQLFSVVFGEGMVNDAVSIILFKAVQEMEDNSETQFHWFTPLELIGRFIENCLLSCLVGLIVGLFSTWVFKTCRFLNQSTTAETVFAFLMAYFGYTICEMFDLSGVISLLMIGIIMTHYQSYNLSNLGKVTTRVTFDSMSMMAEAFIYVYLGFSIWDQKTGYNKADGTLFSVEISWAFTLCEVFIVLFSRYMSIYCVYWLSVLVKGPESWKLEKADMAITCFAGMVRGSVAFALIETLKAPQGDIVKINQINIIQSTVLFIVVGTSLLFGTAMPFFINYKLFKDEQILEPLNLLNSTVSSEENIKHKEQSEAQKIIKYLDENYFKRWFIFNYEYRKFQITSLKKDIKKRDLQEIFDDAISECSDGFNDPNNTRFRIEIDQSIIPPKQHPEEEWERVFQ